MHNFLETPWNYLNLVFAYTEAVKQNMYPFFFCNFIKGLKLYKWNWAHLDERKEMMHYAISVAKQYSYSAQINLFHEASWNK